MIGMTYNYDDVAERSVGDIFSLNGRRVKLVKKTNYAVLVEEYRWIDAVEDWILEKLGRLLP